MQLSKDKIKRGILHDEQHARDAAVSFFAMSSPGDRSVMPVATKAVDTFGSQDAFSDITVLQPLTQTDATISWALDEFTRIATPDDSLQWEYVTFLSWLLAEADASLLKRRRHHTANILFLHADARDAIAQRTKMLSANAEDCWAEFEQGCEILGARSQPPQGLLTRINHLLEVVSRHPQTFAERVLAIFAETPDNPPGTVDAWKRACVVRTTGQMRLVEAIPYLITILQESHHDWVHEDCVNALATMEADVAIKSVWNACVGASAHFHQCAAWVLEASASDLAVEACLQLFKQADDLTIKTNYGHALLSSFAVDSISPVRHFVLNNLGMEEMDDLRHHLMSVCTLMEAEFPEMQSWREGFCTVQDTAGPQPVVDFPVVDTWSAQIIEGGLPVDSKPQQPRALPLSKTSRYRDVRRNQPCPCNSGKKYKNCCLRR